LFTSKKLFQQKKIQHRFFNQKGGKSIGIYKSLNCGMGSKDKKNKVKENLNIVKKKLVKNQKVFFW
jgi:copper oxidase (laccase) domain-containing protein